MKTPTVSHDKAVMLTCVNLGLWPGLGTVFSRRWRTGIAQMLLSLAGALLVIVPTIVYFIQWSGNTEMPSWYLQWQLSFWAGMIIFTAAWVWALITSRAMRRESKQNEAGAPSA